MEWRFKVKVIAYLDLGLLCLYLVLALILLSEGVSSGVTTLFRTFGHSDKDINGDYQSEACTVTIVVVTVLLSICLALMTFIQVYATVKLLFAAQRGIEKTAAVRYAVNCRKVSLVFVIFAVMQCAVLPIWFGLLFITWRLSLIFVVYNYIRELLDIINVVNNSNIDTEHDISLEVL